MRTYEEFLAHIRGDSDEARRAIMSMTRRELLEEAEYFRSVQYYAKCSSVHFQAVLYGREEKEWQRASLYTDWYRRAWFLVRLLHVLIAERGAG